MLSEISKFFNVEDSLNAIRLGIFAIISAIVYGVLTWLTKILSRSRRKTIALPSSTSASKKTPDDSQVQKSIIELLVQKIFSWSALIAFMEAVGFLITAAVISNQALASKVHDANPSKIGWAVIAQIMVFMLASAVFMLFWKKVNR